MKWQLIGVWMLWLSRIENDTQNAFAKTKVTFMLLHSEAIIVRNIGIFVTPI